MIARQTISLKPEMIIHISGKIVILQFCFKYDICNLLCWKIATKMYKVAVLVLHEIVNSILETSSHRCFLGHVSVATILVVFLNFYHKCQSD